MTIRSRVKHHYVCPHCGYEGEWVPPLSGNRCDGGIAGGECRSCGWSGTVPAGREMISFYGGADYSRTFVCVARLPQVKAAQWDGLDLDRALDVLVGDGMSIVASRYYDRATVYEVRGEMAVTLKGDKRHIPLVVLAGPEFGVQIYSGSWDRVDVERHGLKPVEDESGSEVAT